MRYTLIGYYGFNNAGDEILLYKSIQLIIKTDPSAHFNILYNNPQNIKPAKIALPVNQYNLINRWSKKEIFTAIRKSDKVVFAGGGLFQDTTSAKSFLYYFGLMTLSISLGKKVYFLSQGIGPIRRIYLKKPFQAMLKLVKNISVRDQFSYDFLINLKYPKKRLFLASDLAFYVDKLPNSIFDKNGAIGISFRPTDISGSNLQILEQFLMNLKEPEKVFFHLQIPDDYCAFKEFCSIPIKSTYELEQYLKETKPINENLKLVIGMRYHSLVYAGLMQVPFLALGYDQKVINLAIDLGQEYIDLRKPILLKEFIDKYDKISNNLGEYQKKLTSAMEQILELAKINERIFQC